MKKILDYLSRYYRCLYDFDLFKSYFKEPIALAMVFSLPLLLVFFLQSFNGSMETPNQIRQAFDPYYDLVNQVTYEELFDYPDPDDEDAVQPPVEADETINFQIIGGKIDLEQDKVLDKTIEVSGLTYKLVVDTKNTYDIELQTNNEYAVEDKRLVGFHTEDMVVYLNTSYIIMSIGDRIYSYDISDLSKNYETTDTIYHELNENFVDYSFIVSISVVSVFFIGFIYILATYFLINSNTKKYGFKLSKGRVFRICFYTLVPGLYVHLLIAILMRNSQFAMSLLTPIISVLLMSYLSTKTIDNVKDYVKKEQRRERKLANKQKK